MNKLFRYLFDVAIFLLLLLALWLLFSASGDASFEKEITATIGDHECDDSEWHFIITQVDGEKPASIFVEWVDGYTETIPLSWETSHTAHYTTTSQLDTKVLTATATIYVEWDGEFNLSHGPCLPTAVMLSCSAERRGHQDVVIAWENASFGLVDIHRNGIFIAGSMGYSGEFVDHPGAGEWVYWVENGMGWCGPLEVSVPHAVFLPAVSK